ncbi:MAG TPA: arabinan endo-1,5-alpha-L-arabinosidase [Hymenobacter sp.]|jgi:arabinan endo-1,5-alpha-L-arabinosidase|uniref:arabinan endo-1,5-alpha-L-arabinosidase n=1 Tax=Hymenobacter sp. TaxID=1898978 RepID=UPI002ED810EC
MQNSVHAIVYHAAKSWAYALGWGGALAVCPAAAQAQTAKTLQGDIRVHDPVMIKQGDTYYVFHTGKGVAIKTSKDKVHWQNAGSVFAPTALPAWHKQDIPGQDGSLWAPDISYRNGKYHLYYSVSAWMNFNSSIGYATNTTLDPADSAYKWVDEGQVISYRNGGQGVNVIDPNLFVDTDKKAWLFYGSYKAGLRAVEVDHKTGKLKSAAPALSTITPALGEGVFVLKGPTYYYIFASRGICCKGNESNYQVVMGRAASVTGPYLNKAGESWLNNKYTVLLAGNEAEPGRGHNGFYTEGDSTFIVYHAYTRAAEGASQLRIQPVYVDKEGWPSLDPADRKLFPVITGVKFGK